MTGHQQGSREHDPARAAAARLVDSLNTDAEAEAARREEIWTVMRVPKAARLWSDVRTLLQQDREAFRRADAPGSSKSSAAPANVS